MFGLKVRWGTIRLARITHAEWIMRAVLAAHLYQLIYARKDLTLRIQDRFGFELKNSEHVEVYQGLGGGAPKLTLIGESG